MKKTKRYTGIMTAHYKNPYEQISKKEEFHQGLFRVAHLDTKISGNSISDSKWKKMKVWFRKLCPVAGTSGWSIPFQYITIPRVTPCKIGSARSWWTWPGRRWKGRRCKVYSWSRVSSLMSFWCFGPSFLRAKKECQVVNVKMYFP